MAKGASAVSCVLRCVTTGHCVNLPHNETIYLGRNAYLGIIDACLSRKQVAATADYTTCFLTIETSGTNFSGCNGYALKKGGIYQLKHNDCLELLIGKHKYLVIFDPPPEVQSDPTVPIAKNATNYSIFDLAKPSQSSDVTNVTYKTGLWERIENGALLIYTSSGLVAHNKIAAFDLDGTLIKTKSGARFPKDAKDWVLNFSEVSKNLKQLVADNYKLVVFSNQAGLGNDSHKISEFKTKIKYFLKHVDVPMQIFIATAKDFHRKPLPGMWYALCKEKNEGIEIDIGCSFYVGDAAGRSKNWAPKKNKDHSIADRLFAMNLNLKFYTPEEYFLKSHAVPFVLPKFDPQNLVAGNATKRKNSDCEVILMVGCPASGKSFYTKRHFPSYVHVSRDTIGSWQQCVKELEKTLKNKRNAVIDNTNPDKASRKRYIDVAKENKFKIYCYLMTTSLEHCKHNNRFRSVIDKKHALIGDAILNMYYKQYEEPTLDEGFSEIIKVDFVPDFDNPEHDKLYKMFLVES